LPLNRKAEGPGFIPGFPYPVEQCPQVTMRTVFGGRRIVDMLVGEQLPRIC
jgi:hydrogenase expression/formation protein HypE